MLTVHTLILMRHDGEQNSLQPPYSGPYKVVHPDDNTFSIEVNGQQKVISLDCLKPVYVEDPSMVTIPIDDSFWFDAPLVTASTPIVRVSMSGEDVCWPSCLGT